MYHLQSERQDISGVDTKISEYVGQGYACAPQVARPADLEHFELLLGTSLWRSWKRGVSILYKGLRGNCAGYSSCLLVQNSNKRVTAGSSLDLQLPLLCTT